MLRRQLYAQRPTLCMGAPGGLYRPTPRGYNGNPTGLWSQPSASMLARFSAGCWVPPGAGYLVVRPAPPPRVLSAAAYYRLPYLNEPPLIRGAASVSAHRQDPRRWGRPVDQEAGSRRDPLVGGPQRPAEKPASVDIDGWDQRPAGLQLYPRGVGLYKPPGTPMQRVDLIELHTPTERKGELALPFFFL